MNGIILDISSDNAHPITWPAVKSAGVIGVVLKATQGTAYTNPDYAGDLAGATAAGLPVIAYHFAEFGTASAEAAHFRSVAGDRARVLDSETDTTGAWQNAFLADLGLLGTEELDYGSASTLPRSGIRCPLWPADYGQNPGEGEMWQFTDAQHVLGISGPVDASYWLGTQEQFDVLFGITVPSPSQSTNLLEVIMATATTTPGFAARYLYRTCLFREIDPGGYTACVDLLNGGGSLTQLLAAIQDSPEGQAAITAQRAVFWPAAKAVSSGVAPRPDVGTTATGTAAFIRSRAVAAVA